jgi:hypothetical protein
MIINNINKQRTISGEMTIDNILDTRYLSHRLIYNLDLKKDKNKLNNAISVKILKMVSNPQVTNVHSIQVGTSETIRSLSDISNLNNNNNNDWYDWLAGLIDGNGYFALSKKGYGALEIIMDMKDAKCLYQIKQRLGGSIKRRSGVKAIRYRLHNLKSLIFILNILNHRIRNPKRQIQFSKLCEKYHIIFNFPNSLVYENGWLSGFFDSDGTIIINRTNFQLSLSIFQKTSELLYPLKQLYGGNVYIDKSNNGGFKWVITSKLDIENILLYFKKYPSRATFKKSRLHLIPNFYYIKSLDIDFETKNKLWFHFFNKWLKLEEFDKDIVHNL